MKKFFVFIFITLTVLNCRKTGMDVIKQTEKGENIEFIQALEENVLKYEGNYNIFGSKEVRLDSPAENKFIGAINDYNGYVYIAVYEKYILFEKQRNSGPNLGKIYRINNELSYMDYETRGDLIHVYEGAGALGLYDNFLFLTGGDGSIIYVENILNSDIVYRGYWTRERIIISEPYVMEIYKVYEEETVLDEHLYKKKLHKYSLNLRTKEENDLNDYIFQKYD